MSLLIVTFSSYSYLFYLLLQYSISMLKPFWKELTRNILQYMICVSLIYDKADAKNLTWLSITLVFTVISSMVSNTPITLYSNLAQIIMCSYFDDSNDNLKSTGLLLNLLPLILVPQTNIYGVIFMTLLVFSLHLHNPGENKTHGFLTIFFASAILKNMRPLHIQIQDPITFMSTKFSTRDLGNILIIPVIYLGELIKPLFIGWAFGEKISQIDSAESFSRKLWMMPQNSIKWFSPQKSKSYEAFVNTIHDKSVINFHNS